MDADKTELLDLENKITNHPAYGTSYSWSPRDFELGSALGQGKFGHVHVAREKKTGFIVAIKTMFKSQITKSKCEKQILREIEIQSHLKENLNRQFIPQLYGPWKETPLKPCSSRPMRFQRVGMNSLSAASSAVIEASCRHHIEKFIRTQPVIKARLACKCTYYTPATHSSRGVGSNEERRQRRSVATLLVMPLVMLLAMPTASCFVGFWSIVWQGY